MTDTDGQAVLGLDIPKTAKQINADIRKLQGRLAQIRTSGALDTDASVRQINAQIASLQSRLKTIDINARIDTGNIGQAVQLTGDGAAQRLADQIDRIQSSMDNGYGVSEYQDRIQGLINDLQRYGAAAETARAQTDTLQQIFEDMKGASGQALADQAAQFEQEFQAVSISAEQARLSHDRLLQPVTPAQQTDLTDKIKDWLADNTRAAESARQELERYLKELSNGTIDQEQYMTFSSRLDELDTEMRSMGRSGSSLFQSLSEGVKKLTSEIGASDILAKVITLAKQAVSTVRGLDTALAGLRKTADMSAGELAGLYHSANDTAKQTGVTTQSVIEQAAAWSRLGYDTAETAARLAGLSSLFQSISPGMTSDEAVSSLAGIMRAYGIEAEDVLDGILSKVDVIGKNFSLSNADIAAMLQDSASVMAESGNTLEETIALETAAFEAAQDRNVSSVLETAALRLRGIDEETQELDGSLRTIRDDLYDLTGVSIVEDADTYKSTCQILKEMSGVWDSLTDAARSDALGLMFGGAGSNIGDSVLRNFSTAEKAMDDMAGSAGSAASEMAAAMDSIDHKLDQVRETGTGIAQNLFAREDIKTLLDIINSLGSGLDWLTEKLGALGTIGAGAGLSAGIKNTGKCRMSVRIS